MTKRAKRSTNQNLREPRSSNFNRRGGSSNQQSQSRSNTRQLDPNFDPRFTNDEEPLNRATPTRMKRVDINPRNAAQEMYVDMLYDKSKHIVFAIGSAGTGKTLLATQYAIKALKEGLIKKIIVTRPAVSVDEEHGFLPGSLVEKMAPWCRPVLDVLKEYYMPYQVEKMLADEVIEFSPLAFMRGRTFKDCIIILDEIQNGTPSQMKMSLTRIGDNSRMFVTGDLNQHDRGFEHNGLKDFIDRLERRNSDMISVMKFSSKDVERHPVVEEVLSIYAETDEEQEQEQIKDFCGLIR